MVSDLRIGRTAMPSGICVSSAAALLAIALTGAFSASALAEDCEADPNQALSVAGGCLAIESHVSRPGGPLVVFIHGDSRISRRYTGQLDRIRDSVINLVVLARPGFRTRDGRMSTGPDSDTYDNYTPPVIDSLGSALRQLRKFHNASRLVLFGHSGGAMISGILMGRAPESPKRRCSSHGPATPRNGAHGESCQPARAETGPTASRPTTISTNTRLRPASMR